MEFLITADIFNISPRSGNLLSRQILKLKSINQLDFFADVFETNCLKRTESDDFRKKMVKKENLRRVF